MEPWKDIKEEEEEEEYKGEEEREKRIKKRKERKEREVQLYCITDKATTRKKCKGLFWFGRQGKVRKDRYYRFHLANLVRLVCIGQIYQSPIIHIWLCKY